MTFSKSSKSKILFGGQIEAGLTYKLANYT